MRARLLLFASPLAFAAAVAACGRTDMENLPPGGGGSGLGGATATSSSESATSSSESASSSSSSSSASSSSSSSSSSGTGGSPGFCGDGMLDPGEQCDDGNGVTTDDC